MTQPHCCLEVDEDTKDGDEDARPKGGLVYLMDYLPVIVDIACYESKVLAIALIKFVDDVADAEWDGAKQSILERVGDNSKG